jgi:hypothetical protein
MNIDGKLKNLFDDVVRAKIDSAKRDTSVFELKTLETQLNKHLKEKKGQKFKKVNIFNFDEKKNYEESNFGDLINKEIENKYTNKKWHTLPLYLKWKLVQEYLKDNKIVDEKVVQNIKNAINKNNVEIITYDHASQKISNIDITNFV